MNPKRNPHMGDITLLIGGEDYAIGCHQNPEKNLIWLNSYWRNAVSVVINWQEKSQFVNLLDFNGSPLKWRWKKILANVPIQRPLKWLWKWGPLGNSSNNIDVWTSSLYPHIVPNIARLKVVKKGRSPKKVCLLKIIWMCEKLQKCPPRQNLTKKCIILRGNCSNSP